MRPTVYFAPDVASADRVLLERWTDLLVAPSAAPPRPPSRLDPGLRLYANPYAGRFRWFYAAFVLVLLGVVTHVAAGLLADGQPPARLPGAVAADAATTGLAHLLGYVSWMCFPAAFLAGAAGATGVQALDSGARARRRAVALHGRYVSTADLDRRCAAKLARAQKAADQITGSAVYRDGRVDAAALRVGIDQFLWDLARDLALVSRHRASLGRIGQGAGPAVQAAAAGLNARIMEASRAIGLQLAEFDKLAAAVVELDGAYRDEQAARALLEDETLWDLAAGRARDPLTLEILETLGSQVPWWRAELEAQAQYLEGS